MVNHHNRILINPDTLQLDDEQMHYLYNVLRLKKGDLFYVTDGNNRQALAVSEDKKKIRLVENWEYINIEPTVCIKLYVSLFKFDAFEWLIEKAVELGVSCIIPFYSQNSLKTQVSEAKLARWNKIAISSMLQCGSCKKIDVLMPIKFEQIPECKINSNSSDSNFDSQFGIVLHEKLEKFSDHSNQYIYKARSSKNILLASGPEGGFTDHEINTFLEKNWKIVWLGPRRYKAETAPIVAISKIIDW